jgi:hypothetical protein
MTYKNGRLGGKMLNEVEQICVDCIYHEMGRLTMREE